MVWHSYGEQLEISLAGEEEHPEHIVKMLNMEQFFDFVVLRKQYSQDGEVVGSK